MKKSSNIPEKSKEKKKHCPYCHFPICWRHGTYARKGFHRFLSDPRGFIILVRRFLCRSPSCGHTFSVLPDDVLPYCRFLLSGLLDLWKDRKRGYSIYWIARNREWDASFSVISKTFTRIKGITEWMKGVFREHTGKFLEGFDTLANVLTKELSWNELSTRFYRHFYPLRSCSFDNPHNEGFNQP